MGCGASIEVVPKAPSVLVPDPDLEGTVVCTIKKFETQDYVGYKGPQATDPACQWFFVNKTGSFMGGDAMIDLENFRRGKDPEKPTKGEVLWKAEFDTEPSFNRVWKIDGDAASTQEVKQFMSSFQGPAGIEGEEHPDSEYFSGGRGRAGGASVGTAYRQRVMKWAFNTSCTITSATRRGGHGDVAGSKGLTLFVFGRGTSVAEYDKDGTDWRISPNEFVDHLVFKLVDNDSFNEDGLPEILTMWSTQGKFHGFQKSADSTHDSPLFQMKIRGGALIPPTATIETKNGWDPALAVLIGHLCAFEYSPAEIKRDLNTQFPADPSAWASGDLSTDR